MAKRNLLSKVLSGVLAAVMVVTMLPGMSLTAKAANQTFEVTPGLTRTNERVKEAHRDFIVRDVTAVISADKRSVSRTAGTEIFNRTGNLVTDANYQLQRSDLNTSEARYLLLVPGQFYEFKGTPSVKIDLGDADWTNAEDQNGIKVYENEGDAREHGKSYIVYIPKGVEEGTDGVITLHIDNAKPIEVEIVVDSAESVEVQQINNPMQDTKLGTHHVYRMWFDKELTATATTGPAADADGNTDLTAARAVDQFGGIRIGTVGTGGSASGNVAIRFDATTHVYTDGATNVFGYFTSDGNGANGLSAKHVDSTVVGEDGDPKINIRAARQTNMYIEVNGTSFAQQDLVSERFTFADHGTTLTDTSKYIQFGGRTDTAANDPAGTASLTNALPIAADGKSTDGKVATAADNAMVYTNPVTGADVVMAINYKNLWDRFFYGNAEGNGENGTTAGLGRRHGFGAYTEAFRVTTISFNKQIEKGSVIIFNGEAITREKGASPANIYNRSYVIRDENGKRFDLTTSYEPYVTSGDPESHEITGFTEGDEFKFQIFIDPMYEKSKDFRVWAIATGSRTGVSRSSIELTGKEDENGIYTVKLADGFDYEIYADGIELKSSGLVEVVNIPEYTSPYYRYGHATATAEANYQNFAKYSWYEHQMFTNILGTTCNVRSPRYMVYFQANEEDTDYVDVFPFAVPRATATTDEDFIGADMPAGTYKFKIRFSNQFESKGHGQFNEYPYDDRYSEGPDFKVTANGTALTKDSDGLYELTIKGDEKRIELKVEGLATNYMVYAPNLAAYDIETDGIEIFRDTEDNFVSSVQAGTKYRFKLNLDEGVSKGPNFKVMLAQMEDDAQKGDYIDSVVRTEIPEGKDGWYEFTVNNDVEIIVQGIIGGEGFSDTANRSSEEQEAINWLKDQGVVDGYDDGSFRPGNNLTRAEFVKMLYALKGGTAGSATFSDTASHWAKDQIGWGSGEGIINGYPDGTFRPDASISRAEVCQIMWKLNGKPGANMTANFADVNQGAWYAPAVNSCFEKGIVKGYGNGTFGTSDPIERAHMALILYRAR